MGYNDFLIDFIASLKKEESKKQIQSDAKNLGDIKVPLIGTLNKAKTRVQLKQDSESLNGSVNLTGKVDKKGVVTSVQQVTQQAQKQAKSQPIQVDFFIKKDKLVSDIKLLGRQNTKLFKDTGMSQKYTQLLDSAKLANSSKELQNLRLQLGAFRSELKVTGNAGMTLIDAFKSGLSKTLQLFGSYGIIMQFTKHLKRAWTEARELDSAMTDLSRVNAEISRNDFPGYLDKVISRTKELAVSTKDYIDAVTTFSRAGYNLADSETLADMAVQLEKVGDMDAESASKSLLSGLQGYDEIDGYGMDRLAEKAQALNDKINLIGNTASINQKEVAQGIQAVGSVMNDANTSVDEFISMLGAGNRAVQDSNKVALAIRTSALRIRGCTAELREMGEETDGVIESTSTLAEKIKALTNINGDGGVDILEADKETFRSIFDIYNDISKVYNEMSDLDASALLELISGKHRSNQVSAILQNMSEANELLEKSLNAAGTASEEYQIYLDGAKAATERFGVSMTEAYSSIISGDTVKGLANTGTAVLDFVNSFGILEGTLKGFLVFGVLKGITTLTVAFKNSALQASNFGTALNTANKIGHLTKGTTEYADAMKTLKSSCAGLTNAQLKQVLSNKNLSKSEQIKIIKYQGLKKAEAEAKLTQIGLIQATNAQKTANEANTVSTFSLKAAMKGLGASIKEAWMAMSALQKASIVLAVISVAWSVFSSTISKHNQKLEETRQKNIETAKSSSENANSLKDLYNEYNRLNSIQKKTASEEESFKSVVEDLTKSLGDKAEALEGLTVGTEEYAEALSKATQEELQNQAVNATVGRKSAEEALQDEIWGDLKGSEIGINSNSKGKSLSDEAERAVNIVSDSLKEYETMNRTWHNISWDISSDDPIQALEYYNALIKAREKLILASENDEVLLDTEIYADLNNAINTMSESLDTYIEQRYEEEKLMYMAQNGIPHTIEEYKNMETALCNAAGSSDDLQKEFKELLAIDFTGLATDIENIKDGTKDTNDSIRISLLSIEDAIKKVNGSKEGDTEVIGLIEEYELLQEVLSDTGNIQEETYAKLLSCSAKYSTAIRTENGRITVNASKLKAVAKSRQLDTKEAIRQTLALKKQEWVQWNQGIENYNGTLLENIEMNYEDIDSLQKQITQYELLVNSIDEASNAFKRFEAAKSVDEQDMFTTAQDAFNLVNETLNKADSENYGKTNAKKFQLGIELLADDEDYKKLLNAENMEDYVKISREIVKTLSPLFTENEGTGVDNLFKRADEIIDSGNIPKNDKEWADRLDTSVEMFQALKQRANLYEYNNREYFSSGFTNKLDEYQSLLSNVKTAQDALNECTDTTSNEYMRLSKELDAAKQKYNEFKDGTIGEVEDAYAEYSRFGTKSKESFVYYLEQSMGMEDTDITGVIDVLLDKSKALQENLAKMHPDSAAYELYKKQLDDVNALLSSLDFDIDHIDKTRSLEDKISQYKDLVKEAEGYKKTLETAGEGTDAYKEAAQELERISALMSDLRDPLTLEISTNISEIDSQISQLDEKLKGLRESLQHASGSNEAYAIHMDIKGAENEKKRLEGEKEELQQTLKIIVDSTEVDEYIPEEKEGSVKYSPDFTDVVNAEVPKLKGEVEYEAKMPSQQPASSAVGSQAKADGTFHAFSQGTGSNVSIPKNEKALVNELGEEGIVRNGKLIPIKGGAQFVSLKRGDIVFNHKQMEQLKKNGYTSSRGKLIGAHAEGTINAYAGTDTYTKYNRGNVLLDWESSHANPKNNTKKDVKDVKDAKEKAEEEKEIFEEVIDWIERRVKNFQRKFDKWVKQAETAITSGFINKYYKKAFKAEKKELNAYGKAYNRYMKEANAVGLDEKYAKKVRNGTIDIEAIRAEGTENDTKKHQELVDKIQKYQEWYDKAIESTTSFVETAEKLYNLPLDKAADKIEIFSDKIDLLDKRLDNAIGSYAKNSLIELQDKQEEKTLNANKEAKKASNKNLKKAKKEMKSSSVLKSSDVSRKDKKKIKEAIKNESQINLSLFKEGSKAYNAAVKYNEALKARKKATYECSMAQQEYNSWLVESSKMKFDNIAGDYDKRIQMLDHQMTSLDNKVSEIETAGKKVNVSYYESQKQVNAKMLATYQEEKKMLEENIGEIKQGTDEWYEAYDKIQQVSSSISDCVKETYDLNNAISQLHFDLFEDISESIERIIAEQEFLQGLFAHENKTDSKTGSLTEAGIASLGSLSASYYASKNRSDKDGAEVKELNRMFDSGRLHSDVLGIPFNSMDDLKKKLDETYTAWQNDIKETYRLESEIADLMKEKYQAELDMLKELIDAKKEALNAEKDLHDYNRCCLAN